MKLSITQKYTLDRWFDRHKDNLKLVGEPVKQLPIEVLGQLTKRNDYETLYQDINRYLLDKILSEGRL